MKKQHIEISFYLKSGNIKVLDFPVNDGVTLTQDEFENFVAEFNKILRNGMVNVDVTGELSAVRIPDLENVELVDYEVVTE